MEIPRLLLLPPPSTALVKSHYLRSRVWAWRKIEMTPWVVPALHSLVYGSFSNRRHVIPCNFRRGLRLPFESIV